MKTAAADIDLVLGYSLPEVPLRLSRETEYSLEECEALFVEVKRWLWACAVSPQTLIISPELIPIDRGWHCFLLYTKEYQEFCSQFLGRFIHHVPLKSQEIEFFQNQIRENPELALETRRKELQPQLTYLYDLLGAEVLKRWYQEFPKRFSRIGP